MDHAEVHVALPQHDKAKAPATLQQETDPGQDVMYIDEHGTWHSITSSHSCAPCKAVDPMWWLFVLGWLIAPLWWVGVARGLKTGQDRQCLVKRRTDLKPTQIYAWWANVAMTVVSAVLVVLVCAIHLSRPGPTYTQPFYLALSGPADAFPDFSNAKNLRPIAAALRDALALGDSYDPSQINVWLASSTTPTATARPRTRHLLVAGNARKLIVLGYSLAKTASLPNDAALTELVKDTATARTFAQRLAEAELLLAEFLDAVAVGMLVADTPEQAVLQVTGGSTSVVAVALTTVATLRCKAAYIASSQSCNATIEGTKGYINLTREDALGTDPDESCPPFAIEECVAPVSCQGEWHALNCTQRCGTADNFLNMIYRVVVKPRNGSHTNTRGGCEAHDGTITTSQQPCPGQLDCRCASEWSAFSEPEIPATCDGHTKQVVVPQTSTMQDAGLQAVHVRHLLADDETNTTAQLQDSAQCPEPGAITTFNSSHLCPSNCTIKAVRSDGACNATCGQALCQYVWIVVRPATPGGACEEVRDIGRIEERVTTLDACPPAATSNMVNAIADTAAPAGNLAPVNNTTDTAADAGANNTSSSTPQQAAAPNGDQTQVPATNTTETAAPAAGNSTSSNSTTEATFPASGTATASSSNNSSSPTLQQAAATNGNQTQVPATNTTETAAQAASTSTAINSATEATTPLEGAAATAPGAT